MKQLLDIVDFNYCCNDTVIFKNLNLSIKKGTINSIIGANSVGKTTLIKILAGIIKSNYYFEFESKMYKCNYDKNYISSINYFIYSNSLRYSKFTVQNSVSKWKGKSIVDLKYLKNIILEFDLENIINKKIRDLNNIDFFRYVCFTLMLKKPKLLLLDGIFENYTYSEYCCCINFIKKICKNFGVTIIYTTCHLDKTLLSYNVSFLNGKTIELSQTPEEIVTHDSVLAREGIIISEMIDLSLKLKFYDLIDSIIMKPDEMVRKIWN